MHILKKLKPCGDEVGGLNIGLSYLNTAFLFTVQLQRNTMCCNVVYTVAIVKKTNPKTLQKQWPNYSVALTHIRQYHVLKILVLPILFSRRSTSQNQGYSQKWWLIFHSHKSISPPGKKITRQGRERRMKSGKP